MSKAFRATGGPILLASASARRRQLLALLGVDFELLAPDVDEGMRPGESDLELTRRLAEAKADAAASRSGLPILAADTVVSLDGRILGKPADADEARAMLRGLRGRTHVVTTGLALRVGDVRRLDGRQTRVVMRSYGDDEIERYVATGGPFDKAGGYAVQDAGFRPAERLVGCYPNVVGLPLCATLGLLRALGLRVAGPNPRMLVAPCELCRRALPPELANSLTIEDFRDDRVG